MKKNARAPGGVTSFIRNFIFLGECDHGKEVEICYQFGQGSLFFWGHRCLKFQHHTGCGQKIFLNCQLLSIFHSQIHRISHRNPCLFLSFGSLAHGYLILALITTIAYGPVSGLFFLVCSTALCQVCLGLTQVYTCQAPDQSVLWLPVEVSEHFSLTFKDSAAVLNFLVYLLFQELPTSDKSDLPH